MKCKLFGDKMVNIGLHVLGGGYDPETQRVVLIVRSDSESVGTIVFDIAEARRVAAMLVTGTPEVTRVPAVVAPVVEIEGLITKGEK